MHTSKVITARMHVTPFTPLGAQWRQQGGPIGGPVESAGVHTSLRRHSARPLAACLLGAYALYPTNPAGAADCHRLARWPGVTGGVAAAAAEKSSPAGCTGDTQHGTPGPGNRYRRCVNAGTCQHGEAAGGEVGTRAHVGAGGVLQQPGVVMLPCRECRLLPM
jgi:hypothetical protein